MQRVFESLAPSGSHNSQVSEQKQSYRIIPGYEIIQNSDRGRWGLFTKPPSMPRSPRLALKRITAPDIDWKRATEIVRNEAMVLGEIESPANCPSL